MGDLNIITEKDLHSVLKNSSEVVAELKDLIGLARSSTPTPPPRSFAAPSVNVAPAVPLAPTTQPPVAEKEPQRSPPVSAAFSRIPEENFLGEIISQDAWAVLASTPIESVQLGARAMHAAQSRYCSYLSDICQRTRGFWTQQRNVGTKTLDEFENVIRDAILGSGNIEPPAADSTCTDSRIEAARSALANPKLICTSLWSSITEDLKTLRPKNFAIGEAADLVGERWPPSRYKEPLYEYLTNDPRDLFNHHGIGKKKAASLFKCIVKLWLRHRLSGGAPGGQVDESFQKVAAAIAAGKLSQGLTEAFVLSELKPSAIRILNLRFGLSGSPPSTLEQCGEALGVTRERVRQIEKAAKARLVARPDLLSALQQGLAAIQKALHARIADVPETFVSNSHSDLDYYTALGGWEGLLIDLCHGGVITWLNTTLQPTADGWLLPPLTEPGLLQATQTLTTFFATHPSTFPIGFLETKLGIPTKIIQTAVMCGIASEWRGLVSPVRLTKRLKRAHWLHTVAAPVARPILNLIRILEPLQENSNGSFPAFRTWMIDLQQDPLLFIPASQGQVLRLPSPWENEAPSSSPSKLDWAFDDSEPDTDTLDLAPKEAETMEKFLFDLIKKKPVWRTIDFRNAVYTKAKGRFSPNSVVGIAASSKSIQRLAPGVWGMRGTTLTDLHYSSLLTEDDCSLYVQAKRSRADLAVFPLWNSEMEFRWCAWAQQHAAKQLYQSLLSAITPEHWLASEVVRKHWQAKAKRDGVYRLDRPSEKPLAQLPLSAPDLLLAVGATLARNGTCWIDLNNIQARRVDCENASVYLALLIALGAVAPAQNWQAWHGVTPGARAVFDTLSKIWISKAGGNHESVLQIAFDAAQALLSSNANTGWIPEHELKDLLKRPAADMPLADQAEEMV